MAGDTIAAANATERDETRGKATEIPKAKPGTLSNSMKAGLIFAAIAVFVALGFTLYRSTGQDDCYISYWPAHTLAHYGRIVNYSGEAVEQSSSLLWVLMLGAIAFITRAPVPLLGPLLSIAGGALAIFMAARLAGRMNRRLPAYAIFIAATATYLMFWSFSGMEASFVGVCTAWLAVAYSDYLAGVPGRKVEMVAATACCILIRPEMGAVLCVFLVGMASILLMWRKRGHLAKQDFDGLVRRIGLLALIVIGISLGLAAARMGYFHSPVPEPALVKGGKQSHIHEGLAYLLKSVSALSVLPSMLLLLVGLGWTVKDVLKARKLNMARLVSALLLIAYGGFIVWVGGDWMLAGRFLVHVLPIALVVAADGLNRVTPPRFMPVAGLAVVLLQLFGGVRFARIVSVGMSPSRPVTGVDPQVLSQLTWFDRTNRLFLRDAPVAQAVDRVVERLAAKGHPVAHIFSGQMGIVMYDLASRHFGQIDVTDRHGLADHRLAGCSLAADRKRLTNGLAVEYLWYLTHRQELEQKCRIPSPDIIYDIEDAKSLARAQAIQGQDYALVYHKVCDVPPNRDWLPGGPVPLAEYIAVRRDLLPLLGMKEVPADQFKDGVL